MGNNRSYNKMNEMRQQQAEAARATFDEFFSAGPAQFRAVFQTPKHPTKKSAPDPDFDALIPR